MTLTVSIGPVMALIAGILILLMPRLLNFIVAIYLILVGLLGLFGSSHGIHINRVAWTQNVKGSAASNKDPSASKDGAARRLIEICSQSPFGDCR